MGQPSPQTRFDQRTGYAAFCLHKTFPFLKIATWNVLNCLAPACCPAPARARHGLVGWLVGGWVVGWLVGRLVGWLVGWLVESARICGPFHLEGVGIRLQDCSSPRLLDFLQPSTPPTSPPSALWQTEHLEKPEKPEFWRHPVGVPLYATLTTTEK